MKKGLRRVFHEVMCFFVSNSKLALMKKGLRRSLVVSLAERFGHSKLALMKKGLRLRTGEERGDCLGIQNLP